MRSEWSLNTDATNRVKNLLEQAGIPLEIKIASLCKEFCQSHGVADQVHITTEKIVYSPSPAEEIYREINQRVQIYEEFEVDELTGVQLIVNLPIECKYRADVELFGFPSMSPGDVHKGFPIHGDFAGSTYFRSLHNSYTCLSKLCAANIILAEIKEGKLPAKVDKEDLLYKAATSLYDFVLFDLSPSDTDTSYINSLIDDLGLFKDFQAYLQKHHYVWWSVLREWIEKIDTEKCKLFNKEYFGGSRLYHVIKAHLPIICVNGPLYRVKLDSDFNIEGFEESPYLTTSIRKQGWPGLAHIELLRRTPEVPVVVTNPNGLNSVLEIGFLWNQHIRERLVMAPTEVVKRWALECAFFKRVSSYYIRQQETSSYRSDLDYGQWL